MKTKVVLTLKELKSITATYMSQVNTYTKNVRDSYEDEINSIKEELLNRVSTDYGLDANELKNKYLKKKKKTNETNEKLNDGNNSDSEYMNISKNEIDSPILLYKTEYEGNTYYVEMIDGGKVYDVNKNEIGFWINGHMELNMNLILQLKNIDNQINSALSNKSNQDIVQTISTKDDNFCRVIKKTPILVPTKNDIIIDEISLESLENSNLTVPNKVINSSNESLAKKRTTNARRRTKQLNQ
jgi:hypothetical protein